MPNGDMTGPQGMGPMTGRGMGFCAGFNMPGLMNPGFRCGFGRGFGRRFGFRQVAQPFVQQQFIQPESMTLTQNQEKQILETELEELKTEKNEIEKRLKELKSTK